MSDLTELGYKSDELAYDNPMTAVITETGEKRHTGGRLVDVKQFSVLKFKLDDSVVFSSVPALLESVSFSFVPAFET
jgi:hypothetical protein